MRLDRKSLGIAAAVLALVAGVDAVRAGGREVVVLHVTDVAGTDEFTSLWVVDDEHGFSWLRANRPDRRWLARVARSREVELRRGGVTRRYVVQVFDEDEARAWVAPRFRAKYGLADRARVWMDGDDTVPIRLRAR